MPESVQHFFNCQLAHELQGVRTSSGAGVDKDAPDGAEESILRGKQGSFWSYRCLSGSVIPRSSACENADPGGSPAQR